MEHLATVCSPSEEHQPDIFFALCTCGWESDRTNDYRAAAQSAVDHSDPAALDRTVRDMQMNYPDLTRDQILGLEVIPD